VFFVGQRVVCVNTSHWPTPRQFGYTDPILPILGRVYTVRALVPKGAFRKGTFAEPAEDGLRLVEIMNKAWRRTCGRKLELAFRVSRFRPLRATNIDVFLRMLEPVPAVHLVQFVQFVGPWAAERTDA